jgi:hypothetical protein
MVTTVLASLAAPIVRYRHAGEIERRQLRWFFFVIVVVFLVFAFGPDLLSFVSLALLPIGIGIAILRFRLYEIDRIISRTVSYTVLTAILAAAFVAGVVVTRMLLEPVLPNSSAGVVASTLGVALLFQPLRRRIQAATDRRFNRARYNAERTVNALAARLRTETDLRGITSDVVATTVASVQPTTAGLWLREARSRG